MNVYDSARIADVMAPHGYIRVDNADDADMLILNTCHIREKAAEKVYSELGRLRRLKQNNSSPNKVIAVAGCVAQAAREELILWSARKLTTVCQNWLPAQPGRNVT